MHAMFMTKLKLTSAALLSVCLLGAGAALLWHRGPAEGAAPPAPAALGKQEALPPAGDKGKAGEKGKDKEKPPAMPEDRVFDIAFSPSGRMVAVGLTGKVVVYEPAGW